MSERKPLLSDKERAAYYDGDGRDPFISIIEDVADVLATIRPARDGVREGFRRGVKLTDMYWRDLIDRGELIRRDELVKWLEEQKPIREHNWPLQNVIDHLKKP